MKTKAMTPILGQSDENRGHASMLKSQMKTEAMPLYWDSQMKTKALPLYWDSQMKTEAMPHCLYAEKPDENKGHASMLNSQMKTEVMPPILGQPDENRGHAPYTM